jgi:hypothetical protein
MSEMIKLNAVKENVRFWLYTFHEGNARIYDPRNVADLFSRSKAIFDKLRSENPSHFGDLPIRDEKPSRAVDFEGRGYFYRYQLETLLGDLEYCVNMLSGLSSVDIPSMKLTREGIFFAGQFYDSIRLVGEILSKAQQSIVIIDAYFDQKALELLTAKNPAAEVKVLTKSVEPALKTEAIAFNKQYGKLNVRTSSAFHDRFIIIDDIDFYHFGTSFDKHLGNRGFMFSRIEEPEIVNRLRQTFAREWSTARVEV